ncbi:caspase domain-containing protein [Lasiosphaeria miniovina]|uniref:Caspase domain-containing protein n=1 Tax=Lasiosphaeria miniovina TaxID=1954250 RepID=A0AA40AE76_9PEZI|nr:caspase domain-containing protein [Lasiosphaeria miniovina]KAK0714197.1 caspase domain-containing protein [Lasiosphaeria miniovina]
MRFIIITMADNNTAVAPTHWAVLIGINFYVEGRCLQGSVRDVETMKQYLEAGPTPVDIAVLTATTSSEPSSRHPIEEPALWPTRDNVIKKLKRVLEKAERGDFVYIHYSGHGTRNNDGGSTHPAGNLAFVLFEYDEHGCSYLKGPTFANCLRKMVGKGLLVTVVLDCCYSGSVLRAGSVQGADIRSIDYDPAVDAASPQGPDPFCANNTLRDAQTPLDQWLVNPDGYTILAACAPHQRAWELQIQGGERRGALSYFLVEALSALKKSRVEVSHQSLFQHLHTRFHVSWPQQAPMRYGNKNFSFFGKLVVAPSIGFTPIYRIESGHLCLSAGEAHGVHKGDEYAVYPFDTPEDVVSQASGASVLVRVETVRCLTSDVVGVKATASAVSQVGTGWKARPVTQLSPYKTSVRLTAGAFSQLQWTEAARRQQFLHVCTEDEDTEPCIFHVALGENDKYEILDGLLEKIMSLPAIPRHISRASDLVMDVLQHVATFKFFEGIENRIPNVSFESSFDLDPIGQAGASGVFDVRHGDTWGFRIKNCGVRPLYLAIFNFTPMWKITNLMSQAVVQPKGEEGSGEAEKLFRMTVPEPLRNQGQLICDMVPLEDDIEPGWRGDPSSAPSPGDASSSGTMRGAPQKDHRGWSMQIEDYPAGYPRFSAVIASHDSFHLCRRFSNLRARLLLLKQDRLSLLEGRLEKIDQEEVTLLLLGSSRDDTNSERISVLAEIDAALADYDALIERNHRVLGLEDASHRDVASLQNWVDGNGCIARRETAYLACAQDLASVASPDDGATMWLGALVERCHGFFYTCVGRHPRRNASRDSNVHIFPRSSVTWAARMLMTPFVVVLLIAPVVACNFVSSLTAKLIAIVAATTGFLAALSGLTKPKTIELVVAGATYTAVLVVFISNTCL